MYIYMKNQDRSELEGFIQRLKTERHKEGPSIESQGSEWTPLLSKLLLREKPRCGWIQT